MTVSTPITLASAGPLLFSPELSPSGGAVLFVADVAAATVFAFELEPEGAAQEGAQRVRVEQLDAKLASLLGVERGGAIIRGMTVHPQSHAVYL
ncbi:hypothetical protein [Subtercola vilae]|uniref:Uncharacterized protein n=1 Tax=Subtercola vilae TaxID=2056433 RepID=A0A4T2C0P6_9MICO|nr:hypothetical protein [Subtercola vilae]TIH36621.1 hypothetical protein D4765_09635 [Subtercola vilae]